MRTCTFGIAGTFNRIHEGHRALLGAIAPLLTYDAKVTIGVTSPEFARAGRDVPVRPYEERMKDVVRTALEILDDVQLEYGCSCIRTRPIGSLKESLEPGAQCDYVVVSEESLERALPMMNMGRRPRLIVVPCVCGEDGKKISASDIVREERLQEIMDEWCREGEE